MEIYLVGGAVRDELLGYPVYDHDWVVVGATPEQMLSQGYKPVGQDFPVFIHPDSGEEYALARTERKSGKGYTGFQYYASPEVTLEEDLIRRDLTINAIAKSDTGELIDPYNGQQDLEQKLLRHVSDAFVEDPLRVLRVARFAARYAHLGFGVADETLALMRHLSAGDELDHLTAERVWKELERALGEPSPMVFFDVLYSAGALEVLLPELLPLYQNGDLNNVGEKVQSASDSNSRFSVLLTLATARLETPTALALIESLCERLRSPKLYREQALHCRQWSQSLLQFEQIDGETRLDFIRSVDLLRREQRLSGLLDCCAALSGGSQSGLKSGLKSGLSQALPALLEALKSIEPRQLMSEGFKGKALGTEIARRQLQLCQQFRLEGQNG